MMRCITLVCLFLLLSACAAPPGVTVSSTRSYTNVTNNTFYVNNGTTINSTTVINNTINNTYVTNNSFFIGIGDGWSNTTGVTMPTQPVVFNQNQTVNNIVVLNMTSTQPICDVTTRGAMWFVEAGLGVKDSLQVCEKSVLNAYGWSVIG